VAKPKKAAPVSSSNTTYIIGGAVVVIVVIAAVYLMRGAGAMATQPVDMAFTPAEVQRASGVAMGEEGAPVLLYEFADYQCPACASFSTFAHPLIKERLVDQGIARLVRYDFPLAFHPHSFLAARAARCAQDADRYWEYHDVLYGRQPTWSGMGNPASEFVDYAALVGIDAGEFESCLRSDRHAEEVTLNLRLGESLGVSGTPTLMLNGERLDIRDYRELEERVLEAAGQPAAG
jgi:protein-disulfide isomerase